TVPPGTNGGITTTGLLASLAGGAFVGLLPSLVMVGNPFWGWGPAIGCFVLGAACGVSGSLIDSLLGATVQRTTYNKRAKKITPDRRALAKDEDVKDFEVVSGVGLLDNDQVNFVASLATAFLAGATAWALEA
ncbi:hypothetical protein HDU96_006638, partial [Phlyctochytrium bullatum]